ncbi:MAG: hypothetical protein ABII96_09495 [Candidatus Zixiibacteriota bacterium]
MPRFMLPVFKSQNSISTVPVLPVANRKPFSSQFHQGLDKARCHDSLLLYGDNVYSPKMHCRMIGAKLHDRRKRVYMKPFLRKVISLFMEHLPTVGVDDGNIWIFPPWREDASLRQLGVLCDLYEIDRILSGFPVGV